jgi:hypothetical protein
VQFLAEIAEKDASGEAREIYLEMRRLGVPMVALIFRHLATLPGGLQWAWQAMAPAWRSGALQEAAWRIAREASMEPIVAMPREALDLLGVDDAGIREIRIVAASYNLANPVNLLSVTCLARMLEGNRPVRALPQRAWTAPPSPGALPPMIDLNTMPAEVARLLDLVTPDGMQDDERLVPSLYRHFGHRPAFMALLVTLLLPRFDDGSIACSAAAIRSRMNEAAGDLVPALGAPCAPHPGLAVAFQRFGAMIPRMIVVGTLLARALPPERASEGVAG